MNWSQVSQVAVAPACVFLGWMLGRWENRRAHRLALFSATVGVARELMAAVTETEGYAVLISDTDPGLRRPVIEDYTRSLGRLGGALMTAAPFLPGTVIGPAKCVLDLCGAFSDRLRRANPILPTANERDFIEELHGSAAVLAEAMRDWSTALVPRGDWGRRGASGGW